jgi:hypothetical protein
VSLGDMTVASIKRAHNDRCYDLAHQKRLGRFIIRRLLAPRDEAIDLVEAEYSAALQIAIDEWQKDPGRSRRQVPPDVPSGASFRMVRGRRTPGEGLLLIYPLDPEPGDVAFDGPIIGIGVSFPAKENSKKITYTVNNVYWDLEFGTAA